MTREMAPVEQQMAVLMSGAEFGDDQTRLTMEREMRDLLEEDRPLSVYCGYDPSRPDLHLGHTVTMRKLRQFQDLGHDVTFLIGNFTGLVGDASDKDRTRPMLSAEALEENARTYADQVFRILDRERTRVRRNAEWLGKLTFADVIGLCSHFTVAQFLERDNFEKRWRRHDPIRLHEFLYAIMQAYDAVALETDVQVGGSEQLFNLMAGRVLQREFGQHPQAVITMPILVGTDGHERMAKSTGNYIAVDDPPNEMYGKVMSLPDSAIEDYFTLVTSLHPDEVRDVMGALAGGALAPMDAKKRLALEVTAAMYSREQAEAAQSYFESTIQRGETPGEMPELAIPVRVGEERSSRLDHVLVVGGLAQSKQEVRRLVEQGAVQINGARVEEFTAQLTPGDEIKVGKHRFLRVAAEG